MKISVIGGGYVGLVTSVCFAELGHYVKLMDVDKDKIQMIKSGKAPIYERGLEKMLSKHINNNFVAISSYTEACDSDAIFICVGTPSAANGSADLSMIESASRSIGEALPDVNGYQVVVVKSTVPPGSTKNLVMPLILERSHLAPQNIGFAMNPEFLREGRAIEDFMSPDRIVIGSLDFKAGNFLESIYRKLNARIFRTGLTEAEMVKYASNAFLATKISYSNEIGNICKRLGLNVYDVMKGVGLDQRISPRFLNAGAGFGGSCFPKDVAALIHLAEGLGENPVLLKSAMEVNERQPLRMVNLLENRIGNIKGKKVAILGLAFKDGTDDARESRTIPVIEELRRRGALIKAYDPKANQSMSQIFPDISYCMSAEDALKDVDACLVMTEWPQFGLLDKEFDLMKSKVIIEGRKILTCEDAEGICW